MRQVISITFFAICAWTSDALQMQEQKDTSQVPLMRSMHTLIDSAGSTLGEYSAPATLVKKPGLDGVVYNDVPGENLTHLNVTRSSTFVQSVSGYPLKLITARGVYTSKNATLKSPVLKQSVAALPDSVCVPKLPDGDRLSTSKAFKQQMQNAGATVKTKGIILAGLLRDVGDSVSKLFTALRAVGKSFARYHIIILENNSKDKKTRSGLGEECQGQETWCFELDLKDMAQQKQSQNNPHRVMHLTRLRQSLLEKVKEVIYMAPEHSFQHLLMFDGDTFKSPSTGFDPGATFAMLGFKTDGAGSLAEEPWDLICANQKSNENSTPLGRYRDTFALRLKKWKEGNAGEIYYTGNKLVPVLSCFSGLALYSLDAILQSSCSYGYSDEQTCEHVVFNRCLVEKGHGRMAIYPPWSLMIKDDLKKPPILSVCHRV